MKRKSRPSAPEDASTESARGLQPMADSLRVRERAVVKREGEVNLREEAMALREQVQRAVTEVQSGMEQRTADVREANQNLIIGSLLAHERAEAAQLSQRRQEEFLAMLAHELRNPLAPIRSAVALLARFDTLDPSLAMVRDVIKRQVEHMARLLDDLLDGSRVTSGKVNLQRRTVAVREFVDQAVEICRGSVDAQNQQLTLDMPVTPMYVDGDPVRLAQVVGNLLNNAAKYTQDGGAIALSVRPQGESLVLRVSDNGMGISAEALPHIFELFTQEDGSLDRSHGGLGIGLTVVRNMVEMHGGTVEGRSGGRGQGAEFIVTLPLAKGADDDVAATPERFAPTRARILLVDDNVDAGALLAMLLRSSGHEVEVALDGPRALEAFARNQPQVVLCDIGMPGMNGYEVAARMCELAGDVPLTLIALTGYDGPEHRLRAQTAGFDHHLAKPVDFEVVEALIAGVRP